MCICVCICVRVNASSPAGSVSLKDPNIWLQQHIPPALSSSWQLLPSPSRGGASLPFPLNLGGIVTPEGRTGPEVTTEAQIIKGARTSAWFSSTVVILAGLPQRSSGSKGPRKLEAGRGLGAVPTAWPELVPQRSLTSRSPAPSPSPWQPDQPLGRLT